MNNKQFVYGKYIASYGSMYIYESEISSLILSFREYLSKAWVISRVDPIVWGSTLMTFPSSIG